jgi:hypothetical protein
MSKEERFDVESPSGGEAQHKKKKEEGTNNTATDNKRGQRRGQRRRELPPIKCSLPLFLSSPLQGTTIRPRRVLTSKRRAVVRVDVVTSQECNLIYYAWPTPDPQLPPR